MNESKIDVSGTLINFKSFVNDGNKRNFLILHGWGGSSDSWVKVGEMIYGLGFNVYIPDLPGFGKTEIDKIYTAQSYAELIENFIKKVNIYSHQNPNFYLLGHSNGGRISIIIETNGNIKINKLFLVGSAGIRRKLSILQKLYSLTAKIFKPLINIPGFHIIRKIFYKIIGGQDYLNCNNENIKKTFLNVLETNLEDKIKQIKTKTELIWGSKDSYTPLEDGKFMNSLIQNSTLTILDGEKHGIHLQSPEKLFQIIKDKIEIGI